MASTINASTSPAAIVQTADGTGILALQTGNTTAVTVDASQNVGIGTTSPVTSYRLSIYDQTNGATNISGLALIEPGLATNYSYFKATSQASADTRTIIGNGAASRAFAFETGGTERMRIDSSGNLLVGDTAVPASFPFVKFYVKQTSNEYAGVFTNTNSTAGYCYGAYVKYTAASPNGTGNDFYVAADSTATRMTLRSNGGLANYSANNVNLSDAREKTNVELSGSYLDKICAIPVKTFNYIDQNMEEDGGLTLGVIAQDVQAVAPELISESNWGTEEEPKERLSIYQTDLQYALMKCIQEQQALITSLTARITALEGASL